MPRLTALFGTWMAGGVVVPINPLMVPEEVAALLQTTSCRAVVCLDLLLPLVGWLLRPRQARAWDDADDRQ